MNLLTWRNWVVLVAMGMAGWCFWASWDLGISSAPHAWSWPWLVVAGTVMVVCSLIAVFNEPTLYKHKSD